MLKRYWKNIISLVLIAALLVGILPTTANAQNSLPSTLVCETQTGMSSIYEYQPFEIGKGGTAYLNTYLAKLHLRRSDLSLGGNLLPVDLTFYYDSVNIEDFNCDEANPYGIGWMSSYNQRVLYDPEAQQFAYKNENGTWIYFADSGNTTASGDKLWTERTVFGVGATGAELHLLVGADFTAYDKVEIIRDGVHHRFDSLGRLTELQDGGNIVLIYYASGSQCKIEKIVDTVGREFHFYYSSGTSGDTLTITSCEMPGGETISSGLAPMSVRYDFIDDYLSAVTYGNENTVLYTYDSLGRLTSAANIDGCGYAFAYSGNTNTISSVTAKAAMGTAQEESGNVVTVTKSAKTKTTITDGDLQQQYSFDGCGRITNCELQSKTQESASSYTCIYGFNLTYDYVTDESGITTNTIVGAQAYDANGVIEDPTEPTEETEPEETEPEETETSNYTETTDSYGNVLTETHTEGNLHQTTTYTYSEDGNYLASKTDENGHTETYSYNLDSGLLEALIDGNGNRTEYTYNALRELASVRLDMDSIQGSTGMEANYTYFEGRLIQLEYGDYLYDFTYDIWGNVLSVTMNSAPLVTYDYGTNASKGMVQTMTYGNGQKVFYTYNALGQVASVGYTGQQNRFQYTYGTDGSLASISDSVSQQTTVYTESGYEIRKNDSSVLYAYAGGEDGNATETINGTAYQSSWWNEDGTQKKTIRRADSTLLSAEAAYDAFNRLKSKTVETGAVKLNQTYAYATDASGNTGSLVTEYNAVYTAGLNQTSLTFQYSYDGNGNITGVSQTEHTGTIGGTIDPPNPPISSYALTPDTEDISFNTTYAYDEAGQLIKAVDGETGTVYRYTYDASGNIQTVQTSTLQSDGQESLPLTRSYQYTGGILSGYTGMDGDYIYETDAMGNPVKIIHETQERAPSGFVTVRETDTLSWGEGRMLTGISRNAANNTAYTYNADGLRTQKTVKEDGVERKISYIWGDNGLAAVLQDGKTIVVLYNAEGEAVGFSVDGAAYTYVKNLQGDVLRVLDGTGTAVISYIYDPWGVPTVSGDTDLAALNPCSYRSYYYDQETGYYYLQSRYYDPNIGRFLNTDRTEMLRLDQGSIVQYNLFSYCNNSPIFQSDETGEAIITSAVLGAIMAGALYYLEYFLRWRGWNWWTFASIVALGAITGAAGAWARAVALAKIVKAARITNRLVKTLVNAALWGGISRIKSLVNNWARSLTRRRGESWGSAIRRLFS